MRRLAIIVLLLSQGCDFDQTSAVFRPANAVDVEFVFCRHDIPDWVAVKNEGLDWRLAGIAPRQAYQLAVTPRVAIAYGVTDGFSETHVLYVTAEELNQARCGPVLGDKINFVNIETPLIDPEPVTAFAAAGSGFGWQQNSSTQLRIENVPEGPQDLLAVWAETREARPSYVLRHGVETLNKNLLPSVSFTAGEARLTDRFALSLSEPVDAVVQSMLLTGRGTHWELGSTRVVNGAGKYIVLPAAMLEAGDLHRHGVLTSDGRRVAVYAGTNEPVLVALGPVLDRPAIDTVATTPALRLRADLPSQTAYPSFAAATFFQKHGFIFRKFTIVVSAGYVGGTPTNWTLEMPDLPMATAPLEAGVATDWQVEAWNATPAFFFGHEGAVSGSTARCALSTSFDTIPSRACRSPQLSRHFGLVPMPLFERDTSTTPP